MAGHVKYMSAGECEHTISSSLGIPSSCMALTLTHRCFAKKPLKLSCEFPNPPPLTHSLTHPTREATSSAKPPTFGTSPGSKSPARRSSSVSPISLHSTARPSLIYQNTRAAHVYTYTIGYPPPTEKNSSPRGFRMILYSTGRNPSKEKWDGASTRFADVISLFGADDARPLEDFTDDLRALVARAEHVYVDPPAPNHNRHYRHHHHHRRRAVGAGTAGTRFPFFKYLSRQPQQQQPSTSFDDDRAETGSYMDVIATSMSKRKPLAPLVGALRSVKSECEVEMMKASADISARAHAKVSLGALV